MEKKRQRALQKRPFEFSCKWKDAFENEEFLNAFTNEILERYIPEKRWYAGKSSSLKYIEISDYFDMHSDKNHYFGILIEVHFNESFFQNYFLPISFMEGEDLDTNTKISPASFKGVEGYLVDALHIEEYRRLLFENIMKKSTDFKSVKFHKSSKISSEAYESSKFLGAEQSNTSIVYNNKYILKIFRRIYISTNPDYEISRFLTEVAEFSNTPKYAGSINLNVGEENDTITLGLMQDFIPNQGDAWKYFLSEIDHIFTSIKEKSVDLSSIEEVELYKKIKHAKLPQALLDWVDSKFFSKIEQLAKRTAEMHVALGSDSRDTAFVPTSFNGDYEVWLKNRLIYQFQNRLNTIENNLHKLAGESLEMAQEFLSRKQEIRRRFIDFNWTKLKSERIRIHGDYHLGQVLVKDDDFYMLDFEGEPESTIRDRKVKQPPIKDVAGILRSFHYAIYSVILNNPDKYGLEKQEAMAYGERLYKYIAGVFLSDYINYVQQNNLNIGYIKEVEFLLKYTMLEKAVYELGYELNSRPRWAIIPLRGIISIINEA
jgi:maltose alpha-D-glucosyltransferase/alpha-amylase